MDNKKQPKPVIVKTGHLMRLFGVSRQTITNWRQKGMSEAFVSKGNWDLLKVLKFWAEYVYYPEGNESLISYRERWEKGRAEKIELDLAERNLELYPRDIVDGYLQETLHVVKRGFQLLPQQAVTQMIGMGPTEQIGVLNSMVDEILIGLSEKATIGQIEKRIKAI